MWLNKSFAHDEAVGSFGLFMDSDEYRHKTATWPGPPPLVDVINDWLVNGDGLDWCPTYESFLLSFIAIIDNWIRWGRKAIDAVAIYPPNPEIELTLFGAEDFRRGGSSDATQNPLLHHTYFEMLQSTRKATQLNELNDRLTSLAERLEG